MTGFSAPWFYGMMVAEISPRKGGAHHAAQSQNRLFPCRCQLRLLSWTAIQHLANGETLDLRTVPAVVGGDEEKRHGVVLAKSIPAKRYGIQTGESLFMARSKYPNLIVAAPDFDWYVKTAKL